MASSRHSLLLPRGAEWRAARHSLFYSLSRLRERVGERAGLARADARRAPIRERRARARETREPGARVPQQLVTRERGRERQEPQATRIAVDAVRIRQALAEHLEASADSQHAPSVRRVTEDRRFEAGGPHPGQV